MSVDEVDHLESVEARDVWRKREIRLALSTGLKLGSSLLLTWGIALVTRLYIPRFLGPERFGSLNFADAFTATAFVFLGLGVDMYVRKEIAVRPEHAGEFIGGIVALRLILSVLVFAGMEAVLRSTHSSGEIRLLVHIYGVSQFFIVGGNTSAGLLQAVGKVNEMSVWSVVVKIAWAICMFAAIFLRLDLWAFAVTVALTEGAKSMILFWLARRHLKFEFRINPRLTWVVIVASLPFFIAGLATTVYDKMGVNLLEFMTSRLEVGWYGAASGFASMTLLFAPLLSWVLVPLFARSAALNNDEFFRILRRSLEYVLVLAIPVSMMIVVGAEVWISILFGRAFAPATSALRILAAATLLMYLSIVAANALAVMKRTWRMGLTFVAGMFINPICNIILIPRMSTWLGIGGGGAACATATLVTEVAMVIGLVSALGRGCFDRRLVVASLKNVAAATAVIVLDAAVLSRLGLVRLLIDAVLYAALVVVSGAVDLRGIVQLAKDFLQQRRTRGAEAA